LEDAAQFSGEETIFISTPLVIEVGGGKQIVSPGSGFVGGYDPRDGRELWRIGYGEGYSVVPRPVFRAWACSFSARVSTARSFTRSSPTARRAMLRRTNVAWSQNKGAPHTPSTVVVGDELYFVSDGGIATCADARTGEVHWSERLGGNFSASPSPSRVASIFQNETGVGFVVKAAKSYELLARTNDLGERTLASYAP